MSVITITDEKVRRSERELMKKLISALVIVTMALSSIVMNATPALAGPEDAYVTATGRKAKAPTVLVLGDSLCVGGSKYGGNLDEKLFRVSKKYQVHCKSSMRVSWAIDQVAQMDSVPRLVMIHLGTNPSRSADEFRAEVRTLISDLRMKGARKIGWMTSGTNRSSHDHVYAAQNQVLREESKWDNMRFEVYSWDKKLDANPEWFSSDNVHYSVTGKQKWSHFVLRSIRDLRDNHRARSTPVI